MSTISAPETVSVIIPCHNHGIYINEAIESVRAQTYPEWEIIVVDDGSTDSQTDTVLRQLACERISIVRCPHRGPASARNTGIAQSRGNYILPLDADDQVFPTYLEKAVRILDQQPDVGIVYSRAEFFGKQTGPWLLPPFTLPDSIFEPSIFACAFFRKADWIATGGYDETLTRGYEDHDFWLSIIESGRRVVQIPEVLFRYRRTPGSFSQSLTLDERITAFTHVYRNHKQLFEQNIEVLLAKFLQRESIAHLHHTRSTLQLFWLQNNTEYSEESSIRTEYSAGEWVDIPLPLPRGVRSPLRIDPGMQAGVFELESIHWMNAATPIGSSVKLNASSGIVAGTALLLPSSHAMSLLSFGSDPQVVLEQVGIPSAADSLRLRVRFQPRIESAGNLLLLLARELQGDEPG